MQFRDVFISMDQQGIVMSVEFQLYTKDGWVKRISNAYDILASQFIYDTVNHFYPTLELTSAMTESGGVILPRASGTPIAHVTSVRWMGLSIEQGSLTAAKAVSSLKLTRGMGKGALDKYSDDQCVEMINRALNSLQESVPQILQDMKQIKLLRRPRNVQPLQLLAEAEENKTHRIGAKYLAAIEIDTRFNTEYTENEAKRKPIKEAELITPYNDALRSRVTGEIVQPSAMNSDNKRSELGAPVLLPIPDYANVLAFYATTEGADEDAEADTDLEFADSDGADGETAPQEEVPQMLLPEEFGATSEFDETSSSLPVLQFSITSLDVGEVPGIIDFVDFQLKPVPAEECASMHRSTMEYAAPNTPDLYPTLKAFKHANCFNVKHLIADPNLNHNNIPLEYVTGYDDVCTLPLTLREQFWYDRMISVVFDALMAEQELFSCAEANALLRDGIRSRTANALLRDMLGPILQLTRSYTGRVPFNRTDYVKSKADDEDADGDSSLYSSAQLCFYSMEGGKRLPENAPAGYSHQDIGVYRTLKQGIMNYVDTYAKDPYAWMEVILKLLRSGEYKPTILCLENAKKAHTTGSNPVYYDLNECNLSDVLAGINAVEFWDTQDMAFFVNIGNPRLANECKTGSPLKSALLGDGFKYADGYTALVGLWTGTDVPTVSRCDFMDVFTLVDYIKNKQTLNKCPIKVINVLYDEATDKFSYENEGDRDIDNNRKTVANSAADTGSRSIEAAVKSKLFDMVDYTEGRTRTKEYRTMIENMEYLRIKSAAAQQCGIKAITQNTTYDLITQLNRVCSDIRRLDTSEEMYQKFGDNPLPPNFGDMPRYAEAVLDIKYTLKFLRLISYCQQHGISPDDSFIDYLNAVNQFMLSAGKEETSTIQSITSAQMNCCLDWYGAVLPINGKNEIVFWLGELISSGKKQFLVVENSNLTKELRTQLNGILQSNKITPKYPHAGVLYRKAIQPFKAAVGSSILTANAQTIQWIEQILVKYGG